VVVKLDKQQEIAVSIEYHAGVRRHHHHDGEPPTSAHAPNACPHQEMLLSNEERDVGE
jgi:hypothetical protein